MTDLYTFPYIPLNCCCWEAVGLDEGGLLLFRSASKAAKLKFSGW